MKGGGELRVSQEDLKKSPGDRRSRATDMDKGDDNEEGDNEEEDHSGEEEGEQWGHYYSDSDYSSTSTTTTFNDDDDRPPDDSDDTTTNLDTVNDSNLDFNGGDCKRELVALRKRLLMQSQCARGSGGGDWRGDGDM